VHRLAGVIALGLLSWHCGPPPPAFRAPASVSGTLRLDASGLRFTPCGVGGSSVALRDGTAGDAARLVREFGGGADGVVALVRLEGDRLDEVRHAGPEGDCERVPPEGDLEARGNEPFWNLQIDGAVATFRTPESLAGDVYAGGRWTADESRWQYAATSSSGGGMALRLTIGAAWCADSMSGARYPWRASLTVGDRRFDGCALEGRAAMANDIPYTVPADR